MQATTSSAPKSVSSLPDRTFPRREFLSSGGAAMAAAALGSIVPETPARAGESTPAKPSGLNTDPGYVGPHYFDERERQALQEVLDTGSPFRYWGPGNPKKVRAFEEEFAKRMGARYALGVTSGTAALDCAMAALGVGPGDEVIVPAYTWWSDYTCVVHSGALPVFAEIDRTFNLDPRDFERKITPRTRAVIIVHLLGGPAELEPILAVARQRKVLTVEDCAQCVGGAYHGKPLGSHGDVGIYSFQINKMITSGEGGALVTSDPGFYERAARFHDMGGLRSLFAERIGSSRGAEFAGENFRMNELTGAVLGAQLPKLDRMVSDLRRSAGRILSGIKDLPGLRFRKQPDPEGDIGYAICFEVADRATRDRYLGELRKRQTPASTLSGSVLLPVESSVVQKNTRHPQWPSFTTPQGQAIRYGPEVCPQSREILDRFVQVRVGPHFTERVCDYIVGAIREVHKMLGTGASQS